MKAQCCICSDLFENSSDASAAAAPCGHTFHEFCLLRWMENSSTCPTCRVKITQKKNIRRLYFDIREGDDGEPDAAEISNQNGMLQAQVSQLTREKNNLATERDNLALSIAKSESEKEAATKNLQDLKDQNKILFKELEAKEKIMAALQHEQVGYTTAKQKLAQLESINTLLKDADQECEELTRCYSGGGESSIQQLSQMIAVIKREYNKAVSEKKQYSNQLRILKADNFRMKGDFKKTKEELEVSKQRLEKAEQEVFSLERENNKRRRNIAHLRLALRHNKTEGSDSFIKAVSEDSPNVAYSPLVSKQTESLDLGSSPTLLDISSDLFEGCSKEDSSPKPDSPPLEFPLTATLSHKSKSTKENKKKRELDEAPPCPFAKYSIMQKKLTGVSSSHRFVLPQSRVYDGLGGSKKLEMDEPMGPCKKALLKFAAKKPTKWKSPALRGQAGNLVRVDSFFKENLPAASSTKTKSSSTAAVNSHSIPASTGFTTSMSIPEQSENSEEKREKRRNRERLIKGLAEANQPFLSRPNIAATMSGNDVIDLTDM